MPLPELSGPVTPVRLFGISLTSRRSPGAGNHLLATERCHAVTDSDAAESPVFFRIRTVGNVGQSRDKNNKAHFEYSNMGYALLGLTLERITHMTYSELLEQRLLLPTGMKNTYVAGPRDRSKFGFYWRLVRGGTA
ncbi:serine hydrolase domain-containing protein (plasmid) [Klebsiella pneumoniae]